MSLLSISKDYKYILRIALPAIAGLSTQMIVSLVDTALVGRLPDTEYVLAAMGIGVLATWTVVSLFSSLATGTHVLIARRFGEKNYEDCGKVLNTAIILTFLIGIFVSFFVVAFSHDIASFFAADDKVGFYAGEFLHYRFMGIPFFLITVSYRGFFFGIGKTKIFMISGLLVNFLNIVFNIILIYGAFGIKGIGIAVQTLVGNSIGSGDMVRAKHLGFETSKLATIYTVVVGAFFTIAPRLVLAITTNDQNVIETAVPALRIAGFGQIFYGIGVVLANGLQASVATFFVMMAEVIVNWFIFVPISYFLGVFLKLGLVGAWAALPFYVLIFASTIFIKFRFGNWHKYEKV